MAAQTNHILILDTEDTIVLAGAHLKRKRHPEANIYGPDDIKGPIFDPEKDPTPWRLHIIEHGAAGLVKLGDKSMAEVADLILKSGLPVQPKQDGSDDRTLPTVRLDVCESGLIGQQDWKDLLVKDKITVEELASQLQRKMQAKLKKQPSKVILWGGKGLVVAPWDEQKRGRMIIDSGDPKQRLYWFTGGRLVKKQTKEDRAVHIWEQAQKKFPFQEKTSFGSNLEARAFIAWTEYEDALKEFHNQIAKKKKLTIAKPTPKSQHEEAEEYRDRKQQYLTRAEATV